jgi:kinesin family member 6/9
MFEDKEGHFKLTNLSVHRA